MRAPVGATSPRPSSLEPHEIAEVGQACILDLFSEMLNPPLEIVRHVACTCCVLLLERARLRLHFREVLAELEASDVSHLAPPQRGIRRALIDELARYARTGRFPRNRDFPGRLVPYFVDASGTRCAMAHLIESTGDQDLVARVARHRNHARVRELAPDLALQAWLARAGLTAAEAARIQPSYCFVTKAEACVCERLYSPTGALEATIVSTSQSGQALVQIDAVHGNVGAVTVGQQITITSYGQAGDGLIVPVEMSQMTMTYGLTFIVTPAGDVELPCQLDTPTLSKADAISAILASEPFDSTVCAETLATIDEHWADSQCGDDDGGCMTSDGVASPFLVGTALVVAALWSRRA
jgi:hypothetical protein